MNDEEKKVYWPDLQAGTYFVPVNLVDEFGSVAEIPEVLHRRVVETIDYQKYYVHGSSPILCQLSGDPEYDNLAKPVVVLPR
jgi:hypothetical protein